MGGPLTQIIHILRITGQIEPRHSGRRRRKKKKKKK
jgi:hypothetical protein